MRRVRLRRGSCCSIVGLLLFAGVSAALGQSTRVAAEEGHTYMQEGEEAPLYKVIESFLMDASAWLPYPDAFGQFCSELKIDATWASATMLAQVSAPIQEEYLARVKSQAYEGAVGEDPTDWKYSEIGRKFGEVLTELRRDGFELDLEVFLRLVELRVRPGFTSYSDQPFEEAEMAQRNALMWEGMAATNEEAADLVREGRVR